MKTNYNRTESLMNRFDKELKAILTNDLAAFKATRGQFLSNSVSSSQTPAKVRLVA